MSVNESKLTASNFFCYYLFSPCDNKELKDESTKATIAAIAVWLFSLCIIPIICGLLFYNRSFKIIESDPKVSNVADPILNPGKAKVEEVEEPEDLDLLHTPFEEDDETQPPLPHIHKVKVKEDSALERGISIKLLDKMTPEKTRELAKLIDEGTNSLSESLKRARYIEDEYSSVLFDRDMLNIPIAEWIDQDGVGSKHKAIINAPERAALKDFIDQQLKAWDEAVQLKERIKRKKVPPKWTVNQLLVGWEQSHLRYSLMMNEEIAKLKVSDMTDIHAAIVAKAIGLRFVQISRRSNEGKKEKLVLNKETIPQLPATDLCRLDAAQFNQYSKELPPIALYLMPRKEIKKLDIKKLTTEQQFFLIMQEKLVERLTSEQVKECFEIAPAQITRKALLSSLTEQQILNFDYSLLDQTSFEILFKVGEPHLSEGDKAIPKLSKKQIDQLKDFFKKHHWKQLTDAQALELDFSKFSKIEKAKEVFEFVYEPFKSYGMQAYFKGTAKRRFEKQSIDKIMQLTKYFGDGHWFDLIHLHEKVQKFDFSKLGTSQDAKDFLNTLWTHDSKYRTKNFFNNLTKAQSDTIMPLMPADAQKYLTEHHRVLYSYRI
jgi:hypothetical protein